MDTPTQASGAAMAHDHLFRELGDRLVAAGAITRKQLADALLKVRHDPEGRDLEAILLEQGAITQKDLLDLFAGMLLEEQKAYQKDPSGDVAIRFRSVRKVLDGRTVLDDLDIAIPANRITAILGVSGGGKSVTLKHMVGLMRPDAGEVWVGDQEISRISRKQLQDVRRDFSMLFQSSALFDSMSVYDNVAFPLREKTRLSETEIRKKVERRLREVNLAGMGGKFPDELSGGMMKRTALARAMVTDPKYLLLDEPTAGLDPIIETAIHHLICETFIRARCTMVFITHAIPEIFKWCHHVIFLHQGRVLEQGPTLDIIASKNPILHQFVHGELTGPIKVI